MSEIIIKNGTIVIPGKNFHKTATHGEVATRLRSQRDHIINIWSDRAKNEIQDQISLDSKLTGCSLPEFIDRLANLIQYPESSHLPICETFEIDATYASGLSPTAPLELGRIIDSYQLLRDVIFEILDLEFDLTHEQRDLIIDAVDEQIKSAVITFANRRRKVEMESRARLQESKERYRAVVNGIQDYAIIRLNLDGTIAEWSRGAENIFGYLRKEAIGKMADTILSKEEDISLSEKDEMEVAKNVGRCEENHWFLRKDGSKFFASGVLNPLKNESGNVIGFVKVLRDQTEFTKINEALKESEARYKMATRATRNAIWDWSISTNGIVWNEALTTELGYDDKCRQSTFEWWAERIHPEERERVVSGLRKHAELGKNYWHDEYRFKKMDGTYRMFRDRGYMIYSPDHTPMRMVGAMEDITNEHQVLSDLTKIAERFQATFEHAAIGVAMTDRDLRFVKVNRAYTNIVGYSEQELLAKTIEQLLHPEDHKACKRDLLRLLNNEIPALVHEKRYIRKDKTIVWTRSSVSAIRDGAGNITGLVGLTEDITDRKLFETDLKLAKEQAEVANASKSAFLANMSHEIRTPMTAVLGFTELLKDPQTSERDKNDALVRIENSGRALLRLIDDILDISKIEAGKLEIHRVMTSPTSIVTEIVSLMRLAAENKGLDLTLTIDPSVPTTANFDPARTRQVLMNLIGNAIKFTETGRVDVSLNTADNRFLIFEVRDTGMGISEDDQEKLFKAFAQADESITRKFGGTGLGLMLSRRLTENMGGNLWLEKSTLGQGSVFVAKIEAAPFVDGRLTKPNDLKATSNVDQDSTAANLNGVRILVAEDIADNRVLISRFLDRSGTELDFAEDGAQAIEKAKARPYDLILMDIQMPNVDGIQAARTLRQIGYDGSIVALTAHAMAEEVARSIEAGCTAHLTKPLTKQALIKAIQTYAHHS